MDPHSTQKKGRTCISCHQDPRAVGLGTGSVRYTQGKWEFQNAMSSVPGILGLDHPLDAFENMAGSPLVHTSRPGLRTFSRKEIGNILYVGLCLNCHSDFSDSVMKNWQPGSAPAPCGRCNFN
jgi:hypothetical protein